MFNLSEKLPKREIQVKVVQIDGEEIVGSINVLGHKRFSDFIEDKAKTVKISRAIVAGKSKFVIVNKESVLRYEPMEE